MQFWNTYVTYLKWAVEFLFAPPFVFVTALLAAALLLTIWRSRVLIKAEWKPWHYLLLLQFLSFPLELAIAVFGTVHASPWPRQEPRRWAVIVDSFVFWSCLAVGLFFAWRMTKLRSLAVVVLLCCQWLMQGSAFIAAMALSGQWL